MTELQHFRGSDPDEEMKAAAAQELKRCWLTKIGSRSDVRGIVVGNSGALNKDLLKSLTSLQALIMQCLQGVSLDLHEPEVLHVLLWEMHPPEPEVAHSHGDAKRTVDELSQEEKAWAIGVMMRLLKSYPEKSYGNDAENSWNSGRQRYAAHILWINPRQLYDSDDAEDTSRSLRKFLSAYMGYLVEQLTKPETRADIIEAARTKEQELTARKSAIRSPVATLRPNVPSSQPRNEPTPADPSSIDGRSAASGNTPTVLAESAGTGPPASDENGRRGGLDTGWKRVGAAGAAVVLIVVGTVIYSHRAGTQSQAGPTTTVSSPTTTALMPGGLQSLAPSNTCDDSKPASVAAEPDIEICVVFWCIGNFHSPDGNGWVQGRGQVKLRPLIMNKAAHGIDVSVAPMAAIRLLVKTSDDPMAWWQPPPVTATAGDHPVQVSWQGEKYWAVPPNRPHDAVRIELPNNMFTYDGFATFWDDTLIGPGEAAFKPLRLDDKNKAIQEGDLAFNVPLKDGSGFKGLALVDRNDPTRILAFVDQSAWPARSDPNTF
ncbi:hypothetical protein ACWDUL_08755 [Nocardia niigatensis]